MKKIVDRFPVKPIEVNDIVPVRAGYQQCNPGFSVGPLVRDSFTIQYVSSGCGMVIKDNVRLKVTASQCFILRPGESFLLEADVLDPWTYIWIGFRSSIKVPALYKQDVLDGKDFKNLFMSIANCNKAANRPLEPLLMSYIWKLLYQFQQLNAPAGKNLKKVEEYVEQACLLIHNNYANITIQKMAQDLHLDRSYLSRIFKEHTGISIQSYLNSTRLQAAKSLLLQNYSISQVSTMIGYSDVASFSRAFKNYYTLSPKQYLRLNEESKSHAPATDEIIQNQHSEETQMKPIGFLLDLDGVIVDAAKYHYLAWKDLADELGIPFSKQDNELLKGVSRIRSFEIILELDGRTMSEEEKIAYCTKKNNVYLSYIKNLRADEVLPGAREFLPAAKAAGIPIALGSASKNASLILEKLELTHLFDAIIDGTVVSHAKPDPEVFLKGAEALGCAAEDCIVFEDAVAGIEAAHRGNMKVVGVGQKEDLPLADTWISGFDNLTPTDIFSLLNARPA